MATRVPAGAEAIDAATDPGRHVRRARAQRARKLQLSEVAAEAKVSRPTLYRYFASKEGLLEAFGLYEQDNFDAGHRLRDGGTAWARQAGRRFAIRRRFPANLLAGLAGRHRARARAPSDETRSCRSCTGGSHR